MEENADHVMINLSRNVRSRASLDIDLKELSKEVGNYSQIINQGKLLV
jgi:hypothetical protein